MTRKDHLVQLVAAMTRSSFAVPRAVALLAEIENECPKTLGDIDAVELAKERRKAINEAVAEERERCAKIAEAEATKLEEYSETVSDDARFNGVTTGIESLRDGAAAIRCGGELNLGDARSAVLRLMEQRTILLEAVKGLIAALEWPFEATPSELDTLLDAARAAIAKAEGES